MSKIGRPTSNPKDSFIKIRASEKDKERLKYASEITKQSQAEVIRKGIELVIQNEQIKK